MNCQGERGLCECVSSTISYKSFSVFFKRMKKFLLLTGLLAITSCSRYSQNDLREKLCKTWHFDHEYYYIRQHDGTEREMGWSLIAHDPPKMTLKANGSGTLWNENVFLDSLLWVIKHDTLLIYWKKSNQLKSYKAAIGYSDKKRKLLLEPILETPSDTIRKEAWD